MTAPDLREITYKSLNQNADAFIFSRDLRSGKIIYASSNFEKIFDRSLKDYISNPQSFLSFVHPDDVSRVKKNHKALVEDGVNKDEEFRIILPDSSVKWVWSRVYLTKDKALKTPILVGIIEDITRKKQITEKIESGSGNSAVGILNDIIHDLRTPFNSIAGLAQITELDLAKGQDVHQYLNLIKKNCEYSLEMLEEVLTLAELDASQNNELLLENLNLNEIIHTIDSLFKKRAAKNGILFSIHNMWEGDHCIHVNKTAFVRAISNLISNSIKFTPENGEINVVFKNFKNFVNIEVRDTGIGIPEELQPHLFSRFSDAQRSGLHQEKSNGLGLHISKRLVELHGGYICCTSEENKGSTFRILIPN